VAERNKTLRTKKEIVKLLLVTPRNTYQIKKELNMSNARTWELVKELEHEGSIEVVPSLTITFRTGLESKSYRATRKAFFEVLRIPSYYDLNFDDLGQLLKRRPDLWPWMSSEFETIKGIGRTLLVAIFRVGQKAVISGDFDGAFPRALSGLFGMAFYPEADGLSFDPNGWEAFDESIPGLERVREDNRLYPKDEKSRRILQEFQSQVFEYLRKRPELLKGLRNSLAEWREWSQQHLDDITRVEAKLSQF
jgi:hypothetical protein